MSNISYNRDALVSRLLTGSGKSSQALRRAAFANAGLTEPLSALLSKVAFNASEVTDVDVVAARATGLNEDQIFETVLCAAIGQSTRQYDAALAALKAVDES